MQRASYSIVVPVYNSAKTLEELCARLVQTFNANEISFEIILVNDNSKDNSWDIIKRIKSNSSDNVTAVNLSQNFGQHKALLCGFQQTTGDYVVTIDDDLQYFPEDILQLIEEQKKSNADVVYGIYENKKHAAWRNAGSGMIAKLFRHFASMPVKGSSFKLISKEIINQIKNYNQPFVFLDEIIAWHSSNTSFTSIRHEERKEGTSGYSLFKLIKYSFQIIVSYTTLPLRIITWFGLLAFLVCLGFVIYFVYMKYTYGAELGFTTLIVSIFMSTGLILFSIGIIGEYISRLFMIQTQKPLFIIKEILK
jgi:glycosyltransferase involved in cell wall biosynthesis